MNRQQTRQQSERKTSNGKGIKLIVSPIGGGQFVKYRKRLQTLKKEIIVTVPATFNRAGVLMRKETTYKKVITAKTILHYDKI